MPRPFGPGRVASERFEFGGDSRVERVEASNQFAIIVYVGRHFFRFFLILGKSALPAQFEVVALDLLDEESSEEVGGDLRLQVLVVWGVTVPYGMKFVAKRVERVFYAARREVAVDGLNRFLRDGVANRRFHAFAKVVDAYAENGVEKGRPRPVTRFFSHCVYLLFLNVLKRCGDDREAERGNRRQAEPKRRAFPNRDVVKRRVERVLKSLDGESLVF